MNEYYDWVSERQWFIRSRRETHTHTQIRPRKKRNKICFERVDNIIWLRRRCVSDRQKCKTEIFRLQKTTRSRAAREVKLANSGFSNNIDRKHWNRVRTATVLIQFKTYSTMINSIWYDETGFAIEILYQPSLLFRRNASTIGWIFRLAKYDFRVCEFTETDRNMIFNYNDIGGGGGTENQRKTAFFIGRCEMSRRRGHRE